MFPCAHFVLKDKSEEAYDEMLNELNNKAQQLNFSLKPQIITGDYEHAAINAFKSIYASKFQGCLFHYSQCLLRHITAIKLYNQYKDQTENNSVHKWFQLFISLAFIPLDLVNFGYQYIVDNQPEFNF